MPHWLTEPNFVRPCKEPYNLFAESCCRGVVNIPSHFGDPGFKFRLVTGYRKQGSCFL